MKDITEIGYRLGKRGRLQISLRQLSHNLFHETQISSITTIIMIIMGNRELYLDLQFLVKY